MSESDQVVSVTVRLIEGGSISIKVSLEELVRALKQRALAGLHVEPAPGTGYSLFLNNVMLQDGATLEASGVTNGATLLLATEPQVGSQI